MYIPRKFRITDSDTIESFMATYPFATLISIVDGMPLITHLPINQLGDGRLYGHLAKANPHTAVQDHSSVTAIFTGPHAYISPTYYRSEHNVPTWNYAAVHCEGTLRFIDDEEESWRHIGEMVSVYEGESGWSLPDEDRFKAMMGAVRFFSIASPVFKCSFKFNQNKSPEDIESVIESLENSGAGEAAAFMVELNQPEQGCE